MVWQLCVPLSFLRLCSLEASSFIICIIHHHPPKFTGHHHCTPYHYHSCLTSTLIVMGPSPPSHSFSTPVLHSPWKPSTPGSTRLLISYILTHPYSYSWSFDFRRGLMAQMHRSLRLCSNSLPLSVCLSVSVPHPPCGSRLLI